MPVQYGTELKVQLGDGAAKLTSPTGWSSKGRPGEVGLASWSGMDPLTQEIPILLDRFAERQHVESELTHLRGIAGIGRGDFDGLAPTAVRITGPIHFREKLWVITDIEETEVLRLPWTLGGNVTRYQATLKLMEYISPDQIRLRRRKQKRKRFPVFYVVRKGDTLARIAQKVYDDKSKWNLIGDAQSPKIRDPRKKLKPGRKLRIPGINAGFGAVSTKAMGAKGSFE